MKNETLSDKIDYTIDDDNQMSEEFVWVEDVKDFIQKLKRKVVKVEDGIALIDPESIDKLAGDALIHSPKEEASLDKPEVKHGSSGEIPQEGSTPSESSGTHGSANASCANLKCPECKNDMTLFETWDSINGIATWFQYGCEYCTGIFEVKRGKTTDKTDNVNKEIGVLEMAKRIKDEDRAIWEEHERNVQVHIYNVECLHRHVSHLYVFFC